MLVVFDAVLWVVYCSCALEGLHTHGLQVFGCGLEILGRVSNAMVVMSRVMKVLCVVALKCRRVVFVAMFGGGFVLRVYLGCGRISPPVCWG